MKILLINDYAEPDGGTEVYFNTIRSELAKDGHEVFTFSISQEYRKEGKDTVYKVSKNRILRYAEGVLLNPFLFSKLASAIKRIRPDVIHVHDVDRFPASILIPIWLNKKKAKVIRTIHDYGFACPTVWCVKKDNLQICEGRVKLRCIKHCISPFVYPVYKFLFLMKHFLYKRAVAEYIAPSKKLIEYLKSFGMKPVHYVPFFFKDIATIKRSGKDKILYVGALSEQKGVEYLIRAMPKIIAERKNATLTLIGRGEKEAQLKKLAEKLKIKDSVEFRGVMKHEEVVKEYFKHNVVVIPSIWMEQFSLVGLEATECGTPVVASKIGGIPDWLEEGKNGYFAERANPDDIAKKVLKTFGKRINKKFAAKVKKLFSKDSHMGKLKGVYGGN